MLQRYILATMLCSDGTQESTDHKKSALINERSINTVITQLCHCLSVLERLHSCGKSWNSKGMNTKSPFSHISSDAEGGNSPSIFTVHFFSFHEQEKEGSLLPVFSSYVLN